MSATDTRARHPRTGQTVMVYHDPVNQLKPEGNAVLVQAIRLIPGEYDGGRLRLWKVHFRDAGPKDRIFQRCVWEPAPEPA